MIADGDAGSQSVIRPIGQWLSKACGTSGACDCRFRPACVSDRGNAGCTKGAVKQAVTAVKKGCEKDLDAKHYMAVVSLSLLENYETTKKVACRKQKSADEYCVSQVLKDFQKASGKIFIPSFFSAVAAQPIAFLNSLPGVSAALCAGQPRRRLNNQTR